MPPAARVGDLHVCPMVTGVVPHVGGPILPPGGVTVLTGGVPQARATDMCTCVGPPDVILKGSTGVFVMGLPAARMGDPTAHGGSIVIGLPTVMIGEVAPGSVSSGSGGAVATGQGAPSQGGTAQGGGEVDVLTTRNAFQQPEAQAQTLTTAAENGTPLVETCRPS